MDNSHLNLVNANGSGSGFHVPKKMKKLSNLIIEGVQGASSSFSRSMNQAKLRLGGNEPALMKEYEGTLVNKEMNPLTLSSHGQVSCEMKLKGPLFLSAALMAASACIKERSCVTQCTTHNLKHLSKCLTIMCCLDAAQVDVSTPTGVDVIIDMGYYEWRYVGSSALQWQQQRQDDLELDAGAHDPSNHSDQLPEQGSCIHLVQVHISFIETRGFAARAMVTRGAALRLSCCGIVICLSQIHFPCLIRSCLRCWPHVFSCSSGLSQ